MYARKFNKVRSKSSDFVEKMICYKKKERFKMVDEFMLVVYEASSGHFVVNRRKGLKITKLSICSYSLFSVLSSMR